MSWFGNPSNGSFKSGVGYGGDQKRDGEQLKAALKNASKKEQQSDRDVLAFLQNIIPRTKTRAPSSSSSAVTSLDRPRLVQVLHEVFHNQVMTDWSKRNKLYCEALSVCEYLAENEQDDLAQLLDTPLDTSEDSLDIQESRDSTICTCLKGFSDLADVVVSMAHKKQMTTSSTSAGTTLVDAEDVKLAQNVLRVYQLVQSRVDDTKQNLKKNAAILSVTTPADSYRSQLGPLRFAIVQSFSQQHYALVTKKQPHFGYHGPHGHHAPMDTGGSLSPQLARNLFKELTSYKSALPIEYGSSIFVRAVEDRLDLCRVLIMGPDDTPYANGCYIFDVQITSSYPSQPPKVQFVNHGNKRFNPNLYQDGKVCLSLLGTWAGPGWVAGTSTLLQVLISIQSLILVAEPYFNEPGYERELGTESGRKNSNKYNETIRQYTLSLSIEPFLNALTKKKPSMFPEFDDVIRLHFTLKRAIIKNQLRKWVNENSSLQATGNRLLSSLDLLCPPETINLNPRKRSLPTPVEYNVHDDGVIEILEDTKIASRPVKSGTTNEVVCLDDDDVDDHKSNNSVIEID